MIILFFIVCMKHFSLLASAYNRIMDCIAVILCYFSPNFVVICANDLETWI
jgi:hypothetical protein